MTRHSQWIVSVRRPRSPRMDSRPDAAIPRSYTRDNHGNFAPLVVPFPGAFFGGVASITLGVNDSGEISGHYFDDGFNFHGFVRDKEGNFTLVEHPNAPAGACTEVARINSRGTVVGNIWVNGCGEEAGSFVRNRHGAFEDVTFPAALNGGGLLSINDRGDLSGYSYPTGPAAGGQATIARRL